jgi:hypothetical protein
MHRVERPPVRLLAGHEVYQHRRFIRASAANDSQEEQAVGQRRDNLLVNFPVAHERRRLHSER